MDTLLSEIRNITKTLIVKTTDEAIEETESKILKVYPLSTEDDLQKEEQRLSNDLNYKNDLVSICVKYICGCVYFLVFYLHYEREFCVPFGRVTCKS